MQWRIRLQNSKLSKENKTYKRPFIWMLYFWNFLAVLRTFSSFKDILQQYRRYQNTMNIWQPDLSSIQIKSVLMSNGSVFRSHLISKHIYNWIFRCLLPLETLTFIQISNAKKCSTRLDHFIINENFKWLVPFENQTCSVFKCCLPFENWTKKEFGFQMFTVEALLFEVNTPELLGFFSSYKN
jgi:hypothetical protein